MTKLNSSREYFITNKNKTISKATSFCYSRHCGLSAILLSERFPTSGNDIQRDLTYALFSKKGKESMAKFNSARENFKKREKRIKADLEEASKIWAELSGRFRWWQSLP